MIFASQGAQAAKLPHYVFILPDGYTGWIQVIFDSPGAAPLVLDHDNAVLKIKDDGVIRLSIMHHYFTGSRDEFFYRRTDPSGKEQLIPVPAEYVCTQESGLDTCWSDGDLRDGFSVGRATAGKSGSSKDGNSWFFFVGPSEMRKKFAVHAIYKPGTKVWMDHPENDPTPGRIE
jgi:hypothetical protein